MALRARDIWMPLDDAVRPNVLVVAAGSGANLPLEALQIARHLSRRWRVAVAAPDGERLQPPVRAQAGVIVHRFVSRASMALWIAAHAFRYDGVYVHGGGRLERIALRGVPRVIETPAGATCEEIADRAYESYVRITTPVQVLQAAA